MFAVYFGSLTLTSALKVSDLTAWSFVAMAVAWSIADIIRYAFYVESLLYPGDNRVSTLKRLRYSLFLVLYPVGASAEGIQVYSARLIKLAAGSFAYGPLITAALFAYPVGFLMLYRHMLRQRSKQLR